MAFRKGSNEDSMQASHPTVCIQQQQAVAELDPRQAQAQAVERMADAQLYATKKEAEGMIVKAKAEAECVKIMVAAFGGDPDEFHKYHMVKGNQQMGGINASAVPPPPNVVGVIRLLYTTVKDQTGIDPLPLLATALIQVLGFFPRFLVGLLR